MPKPVCPPIHDPDRALSDAIAAVDATHTPCFDPALARQGWQALKQARGQHVDLSRLPPAHMINPAGGWPPIPAGSSLTEIMQRAALRTVHYARSRGLQARSDFGGAA